MDVKNYLISTHGLSAEEAAVIADNPKFAAIYEKAASEAENGKTALLRANETKAALEKWNSETVVPYVRDADNKVAGMSAKLSAQATYLKSLKDAGYDIPDAYLSDAPAGGTPNVLPPVSNTPQKDYDDLIQKGQLAQMELLDLSNEAYDLTGKRIRMNDEYRNFSAEARPGENLRSYVTRKYDLETIRSQRAQEAEQKKLDAYAQTKLDAAKAEWAKSNGANPETRVLQNSRFAQIGEARKADGSGSDKEGRPLWQTKEGRDRATQQRLEKYAGKVM